MQGQVAFTGGYPFASGSTATMEVGGTTFQLFTEGEWAWPATPEDDTKIVAAMKRGADATLPHGPVAARRPLIHLACWALPLPLKRPKTAASKQRCHHSPELRRFLAGAASFAYMGRLTPFRE